ncbi:hypothetical protein FPRO04_14634 [Fusarium proliferatum]|nr:hypothetical protein FPRO04_14634 [Fusarium proliferatum]
MTSSKEQEHNRLRQQLDKIEKEKKKLQNEKDEWRIKAESMESFCLAMEAKLLPEDPIREIQNLRVEDSTPDDNDIEMNDSPIFVDYEKTLESINMTLNKENMELKDTITGLKKLQRDETEKSESQLQRQVVALTNENDQMKMGFRQLYFRAFGTEVPPSSQRPYATIVETIENFTNNLKAESSKKEIRIQELEQAFGKTSQTLWREQADKSDIQAQLDIKTQALSSLEDELQQTKEEKACIQKEGDQWKAQIDELENQCKTFQAKLLPVDFTREIEDLEVKISMLNNTENHQDGSDGSARNSILKLKEELAAIKLSVKNKEQSRSALEEEKNDLLKKIASLEESINTERDKNKTASVKIEALEAQLHIQGLNQQKAVRMQTQIMQLEQEMKSIQQKEQNYKDIIEQYENQINGLDDLIETRTEEQFLKDAETGVREQNQAFVKVKQELEAAQADASNKKETYRSIEQEKILLKEALEEMEQTISRNNKEVDDLTVQLQDAKREIGNLATTLATVESALDRERTTSASDIEDLSMKIERLEKTKQEYEVSIDASENLHRRLREMEEEERTKAMNVQNAIKRKDDTISRLGKDIENIKEGHIREINRLTEEIRKLNNQLAEENKGNGTVTSKLLPPLNKPNIG